MPGSRKGSFVDASLFACSGRPAPTVLIVGAGFAGLSAARNLTAQSECIVTILEASSAVGGRARTGKLPSGTDVELGATWFHGVRDNPVYDMAVWQGVARDIRLDPEATKHDIDWQLHFARPHEKQLLSGDLNTIAMEAVGSYSEAAEECTQAAQLGDGSVGDVLRRTFDEIVAAEGFQGDRLQAFADAWHFREKLQRTFDGFFSTDDVSLAFAREYETLEGPNMPVPGGYQALADILARNQTPLDIRFNHRVTKIEYGPTGVTVQCDNGAKFDADCVIVTTSLGVLQTQHQQLFDPPLPQWKVDAMSAIRIGVADKLFIEFEIEPSKAREAAVWLSSHANLTLSSPQQPPPPQSTTSPVLPSLSPDNLSSQSQGHTTPSASSAPAMSPQQTSPSPLAAQPDVSAFLPPQATGGLPEPFNLGKRPIPQLWPAPEPNHPHYQQRQQPEPSYTASEDSSLTGVAATTAALAASGNNLVDPKSGALGTRPRRRKHKRTIHSYAFLWPVDSPYMLGAQGHPAQQPEQVDARSTAVCYDPLAVPSKLTQLMVPPWLQGLHSVRYCPGPEWIEPSLLQEAGDNNNNNSKGKRNSTTMEGVRRSPTVNAVNGGATHVSGVLWITGHSALGMEQATDEEVVQGVQTLFNLFPQVPVPPGAIMPPRVLRTRWGTDPLFMGSYSYVNVTEETGEVVDAMAEPLCNDDGVPIVMFAGEATYRPCIGTVHGAFLSGLREADRLLEMLGLRAAVYDSCSPTANVMADNPMHPAVFSGGHLSPHNAELETSPALQTA